MLEVLQNITAQLTADPTLGALVPDNNITVGQVDIVSEHNTPTEILFPSINIHTATESMRTVPSNVRDTMVQVDIWSNSSALEAQTIYEQIISILTYNQTDQGAAHIYWSRPSSAFEFYADNRRTWRIALTLAYWSQKP